MTTLTRYALLQLPELAALGVALWLVDRWWGLPGWAIVAIVVGWIAKDVALYPSLKPAYSREFVETGVERLIGRSAVVQRELAPIGLVKIDGALWQAKSVVVDGEEEPVALAPGTRVTVRAASGLVLEVEVP